MAPSWMVVLLAAVLPCFWAAQSQLGCVDPDGNAVDWYVVYKLPKMTHADNPNATEGVAYMFKTSADLASPTWRLADHSIESDRSAPGRTLSPVYSNPQRKTLRYVFYNDEHPDGTTSYDLGHTKGVAAFEGDSGFWLVQSVPKFPPPPGQQYGYPSSGHTYGQSMLCLSLPDSRSEAVAQQLLFNEPFIYAGQQAAGLAEQYPNFERVIEGKVRSESPWFNTEPLVTAGGTTFYSYAKSGAFGKDLYEDFVAPAQKTPLLTETWMNGPHDERIASNCTVAYPVKNIREITATPAASLASSVAPESFDFHSTKDHSKWAISPQHDTPVVCIGDINRMTTQEIRGGGTVCLSNDQLWQLFVQLVTDVEPCGNQPPANVYRRRP